MVRFFFIHDFLKHYGFKRYVCIINFQANRTITLLYSVRCSSTQWTKTYIWKKCNSDLIMQFIINLQQAYNSNLNYLCWKFQYKLIIAIFFHFKHIVYTRIFFIILSPTTPGFFFIFSRPGFHQISMFIEFCVTYFLVFGCHFGKIVHK